MKQNSTYGLALLTFLLVVLAACDDQGLEPLREGISGRIDYTGEWPDSTEWVRLAVFKELPATELDIALNPPIFSDTLPRFVDQYDYELIVPAGSYAWVVLAWKPFKEFASNDFSGLDTLAMFSPPGEPRTPLGIVIPAKQLLTGIDLQADFANLTPPSPILP